VTAEKLEEMVDVAVARLSSSCRRCSECEGQEHHWIEANDRFSSRYECKHCPAQCFAVDDDDDPLGGYKPSGIAIVVTPAMETARDQVLALIERLGGEMADTSAARWLLEEIGGDIQAKLDAIEDGEIEDDPDLDYEPSDDCVGLVLLGVWFEERNKS